MSVTIESTIPGYVAGTWTIDPVHSEIGFNYLLTYLFLGNMTMTDAMRSLKLFTSEVMPKVSKL